MAQSNPRYVCQECGYEAHKWMGKCAGCGAWNTLVQETESADVEARVPDLSTDGRDGDTMAQNRPTQLTEVHLGEEARLRTGVEHGCRLRDIDADVEMELVTVDPSPEQYATAAVLAVYGESESLF